jgi:hypothetical protein
MLGNYNRQTTFGMNFATSITLHVLPWFCYNDRLV